MYVLVLWMKSKTISIIKEENLHPNKEEGEVSFAQYKDRKLYKVKIIRKSEDEEYLKKLPVTTEGEIRTKNRTILKNPAMEKKKTLKKINKSIKKRKQEKNNYRNEKLLKIKSIFENSDTDAESNEDLSDKCSEMDVEMTIDEVQKSDKSENNRKRLRDKEQERKRAEEDAREKERERDIERWQQEREQDREIARMRQERDQEREIARLLQEREQEREIAKLLQEREQEREIERNEREFARMQDLSEANDDNPLERCHSGAEGKVRLCEPFNVWIDKGELTYIQRWLESPKEMTRRLLKILIGVDNLKNMCARGRSKNREAIPQDIMKAVEYYVNKKCTSRLKPAEFTTVINMMCASLRNPKI